jgi:hypothetical protein
MPRVARVRKIRPESKFPFTFSFSNLDDHDDFVAFIHLHSHHLAASPMAAA